MAVVESDNRLLEAWTVHRDPEALSELVSRHAGMVYGTCRRLLHSAPDAEDVTQDCFIELLNARTRNIRSVPAWLHTVAMRRSLDHVKLTRRRLDREQHYAELSPKISFSEPDKTAALAAVDEALDALPQELRTALIMRFLENRSQTEIAKQLGVSRGTVQNRIKRGIALLGGILERQGFASVVLATFAAGNMAEAAPTTLSAALGKLVIGVGAQTSTTPLLVGASVLMSKQMLTGLAIAVVGIALWFSITRLSGEAENKDYNQEEQIARLKESYNINIGASETDGTSSTPSSAEQNPDDQSFASNIADNPSFLSAENIETIPPKLDAEDVESDDTEAEGSNESDLENVTVIYGHVFDQQGYGIPEAKVWLELIEDGDDSGGRSSVQTDDEGSFEIAANPGSGFNHALLYAGAVGYTIDKKSLTLKPGATLKADLLINKSGNFIAGWTTDTASLPVANADIRMREYHTSRGFNTGQARDLFYVSSDTDGSFYLPIPEDAESCYLTIAAEGYAPRFLTSIPARTEDLSIQLDSGGAISGTVIRDTGEAVAGAVVYAKGIGKDNNAIQELPIQEVSVLTTTDGSYQFSKLGTDYSYEVRTEGASTRRNIAVQSDSITSGIDFILQNATKVFGVITDCNSGRVSLPVQLSIVDREHEILTSGRSQSDGSYSLEFYPDNEATLGIMWTYSFEGGGMGPREDAGLEYPILIDISPGDELQKDFCIPAPITVPVRCIDAEGNPIAGLNINYLEEGATQYGGDLFTDENGYSVHRGLPPNIPFRIRAYRPDNENAFPIKLGESELLVGAPVETLPEVVIYCVRKGGIELQLVSESGNPLSNTAFEITVFSESSELEISQDGMTDEEGSYVHLFAIPVGSYDRLAIRIEESNDFIPVDLPFEIIEDAVTDLGTIQCYEQPNSE